ncbi:hypothetical protein MITS9504_00595 [Synechococcus sp. MIT S9504]|nr:hypothetical protein MITS9504_00595 [Synechococcus sp. MIT S9504]
MRRAIEYPADRSNQSGVHRLHQFKHCFGLEPRVALLVNVNGVVYCPAGVGDG